MLLSELYKLKYLIVLELSLLIVFAVYNLIPFLFLLSILLIGIIIYSTFKYPVLALHLLLFSILIDSFIPMKGGYTGFSLLVVEVVLVFTIGLALIKFFFHLDAINKIPNLSLVWLPFLIWAIVIGLIVAIDKFRVITFWKNYFASFILFSFAYFIIKNKLQVKSLIMAVIIWGLFLALIEFKVLLELGGFTAGIIGLFFKKNLLTLGWGRSNYLSAFFVVIIPFTIGYWLYTESRKLKVFIAVSLILMSFAIILTLSRGGILALIIALIVLFFKVLRARTVIPLFTVLSLIIVVLLLNPLTYVLIDSISALESSGSVYSRINFYIDTWHAFLKFPITGVGFGNLGLYSKFILPMSEAPSAHNIFLGALGEVGLVGSVFYGAIFVILFKTLYRLYKKESDERLKMLRWSAFAALLGGLMHTLVEPTFEGLQFSIVFWIIASIAIKLDLLKNEF